MKFEKIFLSETKEDKKKLDEIRRNISEARKKEIEAEKKDKNYRSSLGFLNVVDPDELIVENLLFFEHLSKGEFDAAAGMIKDINEKIGRIANKITMTSNAEFIKGYDNIVQQEMNRKETMEFNAQDNL